MIVADTMLMAYLVIQTPFSDECQRLRQVEPDWVAPRYVEVELQNVLWQYLRRGDFTLEETLARYETAVSFVRRTSDVSAAAAIRLAHTHDCSPYDTRFAVLADQLGLQLVTYDSRLLDRIPVAVSPTTFLAGR